MALHLTIKEIELARDYDSSSNLQIEEYLISLQNERNEILVSLPNLEREEKIPFFYL